MEDRQMKDRQMEEIQMKDKQMQERQTVEGMDRKDRRLTDLGQPNGRKTDLEHVAGS
jgi:hypothetical protein